MQSQNVCALLGWSIALLYIARPYPAVAQITPDATLGAETSTITPNQVIKGLPSDRISGGAIRGVNLFHSFSDFNILEGQGAYFANPVGVDNIISRVTGTNPSNLLGTLGVLGHANLFLLNPNGIILGPNARLDVRGSFTASTSDRFQFSDGSEFSAINPQAPPLLTVNVPLGLQQGVARGNIVNEANLLVGQSLTLYGSRVVSTGQLNVPNGVLTVRSTTGDVTLQHLAAQTATLSSAQNLNLTGSQLVTKNDLTLLAQDTVYVRDTVSQPVSIGAGGQLLVQGDHLVDIFALNHRDSGFFSGGDTVLRSTTPVSGDAHYWAGGNFRIEQLDRTLGSLYSPHDPIIRASGDVTFNSYVGPSLHILAGGQVSIPGTVTINATDILADTINPISTPDLAFVTLSNGDKVTIDGSNTPTLDIRSGTTAFGSPGATETGGAFGFFLPFIPNVVAPRTSTNITIGNIRVNQPNGQIYLSSNYSPDVSLPSGSITINGTIDTRSATKSGVVVVDARDNIVLNAPINISSVTGTAGDVKLLAKNNIVLNAQIDTRSSFGDAGQVTLQARENIFINQSIRTDVRLGSTGNGGSIQVNASQIKIQNGAQLSANTFSSGSGGNIQINAQQLTLENNAQIASITGDDLRSNPAATANIGRGGNIEIVANTINLQNQSFIFAQTNALSSGNAGNLSITANQLNLQDGSFISGATLGQGWGSTMRLDVADTLTLTGTDTTNTQTGIFLNSFQSGNAGRLEILNARQLTVQAGALISASASATGRAGNISINTPNGLVQISGVSKNPRGQTASSILSETQNSGRGGDVVINARQLLLQDGGQISAQTIATGEAGTLVVNASEQVRIAGTNGRFSSRLTFSSSDVGRAGGVQIKTNQLTLENGAQITVSGTGTGASGDLEVDAGSIFVRDGARLTATTLSGEGGNIRLQAKDSITLRRDGDIRTQAFGTGNGGNIRLEAGNFILGFLSEDSDVIASAVTGRGGNIFAKAVGILGFRRFDRVETPESDFIASSESSLDGTITLDARNPIPSAPLPTQVAPPPLAQGCLANPRVSQAQINRFFESRRGGLPPKPSESLASGMLWEDQREARRDRSSPSPLTHTSVTPEPTKIIEASSFKRDANGDILLIADETSVPEMQLQVELTCHGYTSRQF